MVKWYRHYIANPVYNIQFSFHFSSSLYTRITRANQKVKNICAYSPRTCFVAADHWFLVYITVWCWQLPHAAVRRTLSCGKCIDSCVHGCDDWESRRLWGARYYSFSAGRWDLRLSCEEASSRLELFCCATMHVRVLSDRHKPCCMSNSIGTSSTILRIIRTWHHRTFSCFQKMEHLTGKCFTNDW